MTSILVTGIGGTRSIAVLKALRMTNNDYKVIGTDANYFNPGSFQCDKSYIVPFASDPGYLPKLEEIIKAEDIKIIFATVEKEVAYLATQKQYLEETHGVQVIVPDSAILDTCFDKYKTQAFLKDQGFTHIPCIYAGDAEEVRVFASEHGLPLIRKPVFGYGSKGLSIIKTQDELDAMELDDTYVLQQYIENSDNESFYNLELNEYTSEIFVAKDGSVAGGIIIKRALRSGETVAGYLVKDEETIAYLSKIALTTGIHGPVNFQYRVHDDKLYIFEINPLFSGTTAVRATLGFNSVELAVASFVRGEQRAISQEDLRQEYFMRYLEEVFIKPEALQTLREKNYIANE
jgi:carbamoyl-phosphate synthase large subunit